jgi:hypothetical protein
VTDRRALAWLGLGWVAAVLVLGTGPEIALDDSWNYAQMTRGLLETGQLRFSHYDSALPILHLAWGALVTGALGFSLSHTVLANLLAAFLALGAAYFLARQFGLSPEGAFWVTAATGAAPPFFVLAFTYMADFWFLIPAWASLGFFLRHLRGGRDLDLAAAGGLAALSLWNRQHGLLLVAAYAVFFLTTRRRKAATWTAAAWLVGLPGLAWLALKLATPTLQPVQTTLARKGGEIVARLLDPALLMGDGLERGAILLLCLGAYAAPFLLGYVAAGWAKPCGVGFWGAVTAGGGLAVAVGSWQVFGQGELFPFESSVLREFPPVTARWLLAPWTLLAVLGAAGLVATWGLALTDKRGRDETARATWLAGGLFAAALVPLVYFMDRYFLALIPLALLPAARLATADKMRPAWRRAGLALLVLLLVASGLRVTHWRTGIEAQWAAADALLAAGTPALAIDGGYAWTGWRNFGDCLKLRGPLRVTPLDSHYVTEMCPRMNVEYDVVFHEMAPPRKLIRTAAWANVLGVEQRVFVYRRGAPTGQ